MNGFVLVYKIWHRGSLDRGCIYLFHIFCQSVKMSRICEVLNFLILHWLSLSLLTHVCATVRLW